MRRTLKEGADNKKNFWQLRNVKGNHQQSELLFFYAKSMKLFPFGSSEIDFMKQEN